MIEDVYVEPKWYDEFRHTNGIVYLMIRISRDKLDTPVPEGAHALGQILDADGEVVRQKTVLEFISGGEGRTGGFVYDVDGTDDVVFLASAVDAPTYRFRSFSDSDAEQWKAYAEIVWGGEHELLTLAQARELIVTE